MNQIKHQDLCLALFIFLAPALAFSRAFAAGLQEGSKWTTEELESAAAKIGAEVEAIRAQKFKRPVAVELIDGAGFIRYVEESMDEMSTPQQRSAEEDIFKMLGLVPADMDLASVAMDMLAGQVGGFYDSGKDTFYLMEAFTGNLARVILSHELTHALDDQLYDLGAGLEQRSSSRDALSAYQALAEGSGTAVMTLWTMKNIGSLSPADLEEAQSMGMDSLAKAPEALWKPLLAAYTTGQAFLDRGYRSLKKANKSATLTDATNQAFQMPPRSTEQVLHPDKYWNPEGEVDEPQVVLSALPAPLDWELLDQSVLGELHLALITEEPKPVDFNDPMQLAFLKYTNPAAEGWGGDLGVLYGKGEARLYVLTTAWDSREDSAEFETAMRARLDAWRAKLALLDPQGLGSGVELLVSAQDIPSVTISIWYGCSKP